MVDKFIIGVIGSPHGLKGHVKVRSMSGEIDHLLKLREVTVNKDGKENHLKIEESAPAQQAVLIRFAGIDSPEKAKMLAGAKLIAERDQAAPLGKDEFYIEDLKGLAVTDEAGETIGHITDVIEGGGGELAEIRLADSKEKKFVPFRKEFFREICPGKSTAVLENLWILE